MEKEDLDKFPDDSTVFQQNMLDCYLDWPGGEILNDKFEVIDSQCFAECSAFYCLQSKRKPKLHKDSQSVVLDNELMERNNFDPQLIKVSEYLFFLKTKNRFFT